MDRRKPTTPPKPRTDCIHLGRVLSYTDSHGQRRLCAGAILHECERHGECRLTEKWSGQTCGKCPDYCSRDAEPPEPSGPVPTRLLARFDEHNLFPKLRGKRFNPSNLSHRDGYAFAFRTGWAGSDIYCLQLDRDFAPAGEPVKLRLARRRQSDYGREDPRLFLHKGKLHVMFTGVSGRWGPTHVLFARLSDDFAVEDLFCPAIPNRQPWEKNHSYFDHDGDLYAIYTIDPGHRVMRVRSEQVEFLPRTRAPRPWTGGQQRGGACPVRVGDEWWHFFHSRQERHGHRVYEMGLYTFSVKPPFAPLRIISEPILTADPGTKPMDQYASVVWPGGAVQDGERWVIALGIHDRWSELHAIDHAELESRLVPCAI